MAALPDEDCNVMWLGVLQSTVANVAVFLAVLIVVEGDAVVLEKSRV